MSLDVVYRACSQNLRTREPLTLIGFGEREMCGNKGQKPKMDNLAENE